MLALLPKLPSFNPYVSPLRCRVSLYCFTTIGRIEKIFKALRFDPIGFTLFIRCGHYRTQHLKGGKSGANTPIFKCFKGRYKIDIGNFRITLTRTKGNSFIPVYNKRIEINLTALCQTLSESFEHCDRVAAMIKDSQTKDNVKFLFVKRQMLHSEKFIHDITFDVMVDKIKLRLKESRGVKTDHFRGCIFEKTEHIIAVIAPDIGNFFAAQIKMGTEKVVFEIRTPFRIDKMTEQIKRPLTPRHHKTGNPFKFIEINPLIASKAHRIAQINLSSDIRQLPQRFTQRSDIFPCHPF